MKVFVIAAAVLLSGLSAHASSVSPFQQSIVGGSALFSLTVDPDNFFDANIGVTATSEETTSGAGEASFGGADFDDPPIQVSSPTVLIADNVEAFALASAMDTGAADASLTAVWQAESLFSFSLSGLYELDYTLNATADPGDLLGDVSAGVEIEVFVNGQSVFMDSVSTETSERKTGETSFVISSFIPDTFGQQNLSIELRPTGSLDVTAPATVPLPAAGWLMVAGLGGLVCLRRRKRSVNEPVSALMLADCRSAA